MLLARLSETTGVTGLWRALAPAASASRGLWGGRGMASGAANNDRPSSTDPGVAEARRAQPTSLGEPPLLHDSMSGADYGYAQRYRGARSVVRMSSISEPDYYLQNSMSEGTYDMPAVLQRSASLNPRRGQGFSTGRQLPQMQRIVVASRAAPEPEGPLHDSFSHGEYTPRYKKK